ncbi:MAG: DUF2782 domain-containing protein [Magnetococcales bacterium]|nr:DUF2782 domain-containing protein [Magnetococcales bacterium]MBF0322101.1 DUF2782 domain-containing protein [Magnetococcales bacterium]
MANRSNSMMRPNPIGTLLSQVSPDQRRVGLAFFLLTWFPASLAWSGIDFPLPPHGALVSQFEEDLAPDNPGQKMVIRLYEDGAENQVREFVINGAVFQVQVSPSAEPGYYLVDTTGNGRFDTRLEGDAPRLVLPPWVLYRK